MPPARQHNFAPLWRPIALLAGMFVLGALGFYFIGLYNGQGYDFLDCVYMTAVSLTTVGYGDVLGIGTTTAGRIYLIVLLVGGMGVTLYSVSSVTAFIVEGHLQRLFRERNMQKKINALNGHYIQCGVGETGIHVLHEMLAAEVPFVVVDQDEEACQRAASQIDRELLYVVGDGTHEQVLATAGIGRAKGLVATLADDKDNLFLVVTANFMNQDLRIVAKCIDHDSVAKFKRAGASYVVSPNYIGGMRIASQMLRPNVVNFLDNMLRGRDKSIRVDEIEVPEGAGSIGQTLRDLRIGERSGMLVIAVRDPGSDEFDYNPGGSRVLQAGSLLVVIGRINQTEALRRVVRDG